MKFLFIVQGEGRGHMTQAISLADMLRSEGHEIVSVLVGKSKQREVPQFFYQKIKSEVTLFESPNFVVDKKSKKINLAKTIFFNTLKIRTFTKSMFLINRKVKETNPDVIINFYDLMGGLFSFFCRPKAEYVCIGHQYLLLHPEFQFPKGFKIDRLLLRLNTRVVSLRSKKYLALSFKPMKNIPEKHIYVVPPLLRPEVTRLIPEKHGYILGYMLNSEYAEDIEAWHRQNTDTNLHFFWDKKDAPEELQVAPNLVYHKINDVNFLEMMNNCDAYCSTAGFESICEAMYLGKPIMMVPSYGHFEQACNALDGSLAGAGIASETFNLTSLKEYMPHHIDISAEFCKWADSSKEKFLALLTK
jgi:uncharacterized protein (TIGR00661 family)